ncbi:MAG: response regulator transcription factor [Phycisphaeraceae bacterium]|nr:response regulator transcription factor [Phycisphaeraceae bacterium]
MRALIVEDNVKMADGIRLGLEGAGIQADVSHTGAEGEDLAVGIPFDAILLDLMLPDRDGFEVCRNLRRRKVATPILMLTALSTTEDKVLGFDCGADDFLAKPFRFEELLARMRAMTRRHQSTESKALRCDDLTLDLYTRRATRGDNHWDLSAREFALLEFLLRSQNRVLTRAQIGEAVWDLNFEPSSNVIDVYISALRRKVDRPGSRQLIHTVKNAGYRFGVLD